MIASHRGGAQLWPENSALAFEETAKLPVEMVEFDVQRSRDGVLVVFHDGTLERVTNGSGPVGEKDFADLRRLTLAGTDGETILSLDEALEILGPTDLLLRLEIKPGAGLAPYPGIEAELADALHRQGLLERSQVTSFRLASLEEFEQATGRPGAGLLWLVSPQVLALLAPFRRILNIAAAVGIDRLGLHIDDLDDDHMAEAAASGVRLGAWAAHDAPAIEKAARLGVVEFTTDRPDIAIAVRAAVTEAA